jgi:hypothetical protein
MPLSKTTQMCSEDHREAPPVSALLIGDRDLEAVAQQLRQMKVDTYRIHDGDERQRWREPEQLLVVSGRQALALETLPSREKRSFTAIAIFEESTKAFRAQIDPLGFDHLVQSPVHPEALALLLGSALHRSEERRRSPRLAFGWDVTWSTGWWRRRATIPEISSEGCRLQVKRGAVRGGRVQVTIPAGVRGSPAISLWGRVLRSQACSASGAQFLSLAFERPDARTRAALDSLLERLQVGPPTLS